MRKDPYVIAKENNIIIIGEPLATVSGYYSNIMGKKFIHVNDALPGYYRRYVVAHLLYTALNNPNEMAFLKEKQAPKFLPDEIAANYYAINLLLDGGKFESFDALGMTKEEVEELSERLTRVWGKFDTAEEQICFIIDKMKALAERNNENGKN